MISNDFGISYRENLEKNDQFYHKSDSIKIVYTPLHGTGNLPVREVLFDYGFHDVLIVPEQEKPDPEFPTVEIPNPENPDTFLLAIQLGAKHNADLLLATDPDADRLRAGVLLPTGGYDLLTGNQLGVLLLDYKLMKLQMAGELPSNGIVLKTIVTSEMGRAVAAKYGIRTEDVLTGFKFIAHKMELYSISKEFEYLFGYEESYGYLPNNFVNDKDAIQTALLTAEAAAYYKRQGISMHKRLKEIYKEVGYYQESLISVTIPGKNGVTSIDTMIKELRDNPPVALGKLAVVSIEDYYTGVVRTINKVDKPTQLPKSNVLKFWLEDGSWCCVRPSGTEPKCKFYLGVQSDNGLEALNKCKDLETVVNKLVNSLQNKS